MKKPLKESKFIKWAKKAAPKALKAVGSVVTGNPLQAVTDLFGIIEKENPDNLNDDQMEHALNLKNLDVQQWNLHLQDLQGARSLYEKDSALQKVFAIIFLASYITVSLAMLYGVWKMAVDKVELDNVLVAFVTSIFTAMSTKVNTMVDFLFGGSIKPDQNTND